ncbi:MAG: hypothetical protein RH859_09725 [Longimicrobiales bacterium]
MRSPTTPTARLRTLALAAALALSGCSVGGNSPSPFDQGGEAAGQIQITIDNQNFNDVRIFAVTTRGPQSLGQAGGRSTRVFRLEWRQLDEIRFRLEFLAGSEYTTQRINVSPGDAIDVYIPQNPQNTVVRRR